MMRSVFHFVHSPTFLSETRRVEQRPVLTLPRVLFLPRDKTAGFAGIQNTDNIILLDMLGAQPGDEVIQHSFLKCSRCFQKRNCTCLRDYNCGWC
jgi:hypothetical protein